MCGFLFFGFVFGRGFEGVNKENEEVFLLIVMFFRFGVYRRVYRIWRLYLEMII